MFVGFVSYCAETVLNELRARKESEDAKMRQRKIRIKDGKVFFILVFAYLQLYQPKHLVVIVVGLHKINFYQCTSVVGVIFKCGLVRIGRRS